MGDPPLAGELPGWRRTPAPTSQARDSPRSTRDLPLACDNTYSDARLDGTSHMLYNEDCFESGICVGWGTNQIDGSDGSWSGWWHEIDDDETDGEDNTSFHIVLTGDGGYEGLTAIIYSLGVWEAFPTSTESSTGAIRRQARTCCWLPSSSPPRDRATLSAASQIHAGMDTDTTVICPCSS